MMKEELKPADYLLGRKTFEIFASYWPQHADFWPGINDGAKYVLSRSKEKSDWKNTGFLKTVADIEKLKQSKGSDIQVWGSSQLIQLLLTHDLVDELRLKIYPLILGEGLAPAWIWITGIGELTLFSIGNRRTCMKQKTFKDR